MVCKLISIKQFLKRKKQHTYVKKFQTIKEFKVKKVKLKFPDIKFELNIDIEY